MPLILLVYLLGLIVGALYMRFTAVHPGRDPSGHSKSWKKDQRLSLLEEWRGVRDEALSELSGIKGCIFVHTGGFIGGNQTQEGALEMARRTLQAAAQTPANGSS